MTLFLLGGLLSAALVYAFYWRAQRDVAAVIDKELDFLKVMRAQRVDGIILAPSGTAADYRRADLKNFPVPIVLVERLITSLDTDSVVRDNHGAALDATGYLIGLGHRRIATVAGFDEISTGAE